MSQTLAQRRALAAHAASHSAVRTAPRGAAPSGQAGADRTPDLGRFAPLTPAALGTVKSLIGAGARLLRVDPGRVLLKREDSVCEVDAAGRVKWN